MALSPPLRLPVINGPSGFGVGRRADRLPLRKVGSTGRVLRSENALRLQRVLGEVEDETHERDLSVPHLGDKGVAVDGFEESGAELAVNRDRGADDVAPQLFILE